MTSDAEPLSDDDPQGFDRHVAETPLEDSALDIVCRWVNNMCAAYGDSDHATAIDLIGDARYHRARVRELEQTVEGLAILCEANSERMARVEQVEAERDEIREHLNGMYESAIRELHGVEAERDDLRRKVEAARTALDALVRESGAGNQAARAIAIYREAIAALVPQTGEVGS